MAKLFLLDAYALIYRAHFAFSKNPRINSKGMDTGAIFGFTNTLLDIILREKPSHLGVAFDREEPTFRHKEFQAYKAQRSAQPEAITFAIPYIKKILAGFGIPVLEAAGYEADDVIGTLAKKAEAQGFQVFMMTPDKDYAQLVSDNIFLYKPAYMGNEIDILDRQRVLQKFDIEEVSQVIDFLGLQGDASDNIPGLPGVGEKTAVKLLKEYKTIENLVANSEHISGKLGENIRKHKDQALLCKRLVTIVTDVEIEWEADKLALSEPSRELLQPIFEELEFKTIAKRLFGETEKKQTQSLAPQGSLFETPSPLPISEEDSKPQPSENSWATLAQTQHRYHILESFDQIQSLCEFLLLQNEFCFDTETTSTQAFEAELVGLSFCYLKNEAYYIPVNSQNVHQILFILQPAFLAGHITKIAHNFKYDYIVLANYGIEIKGAIYDTMLASYVLEPEGKHSMDALSMKLLSYAPIEIETLIGKKGKNQGSMSDVPLWEIGQYAAEDADITFQLKAAIEERFKKNYSQKEKINFLLENIEFPLIKVLADMERAGIKIDTQSLLESSEILDKESKQLEFQIYAQAGEPFNIGSPKQLGVILYEKLKLTDKPKKTKTGQYATGEEVLQYLSDFQIVADILEYRELQKLKNTYVDTLPVLISPKDQRIHTTYNQAVAATGRLSSNNPNLQNIPIRTQKGKEIRKAFVAADPNHLLLSVDYSQVELRIMAAFSGDQTMLQAFRESKDIHSSTASKIFRVEIEEVDSDMRRKAKTANFGIIYGISAFGLSQRLNIPRKEAAALIEAYFAEFPAVKRYMENIIAKAREQGYVETLFGRRRHLPDINSRNANQRAFAERNAINSPIQGTAADIIKLAMVKVHEFLVQNQLRSKMLLQVHDELLFDVELSEKDFVKENVAQIMRQAAPELGVPLEVECGFGQNWLQAH
jgi:DNA polymerase-1